MGKRHQPEEIIGKLREAEIVLAPGGIGHLGRYRSNVWQYPGASGFSSSRAKDLEDHPTVKPVRLVADAIRDATIRSFCHHR